MGEESNRGTCSWPLGLLNEGVGSGSEAGGGGNGELLINGQSVSGHQHEVLELCCTTLYNNVLST